MIELLCLRAESMSACDIVQGLWIGSRLSTMERLSVQSFLSHGHPFHLYTYDGVDNPPAGTTLVDASSILPRERVFRWPAGSGSYAAFSNYFRYHLLLQRGNWWVDVDTVCLRPFRFDTATVVSSERVAGARFIASGILRFPPGSRAMELACRVCDGTDPESLSTCQAGPYLVDWLVRKLNLDEFVQSPDVFCPIPCSSIERLLTDPVELPDNSSAVHLWNEAWSDRKLDKNASYRPESLYETLKRAYLAPT
jgi:hypothetical protein